MFQKESVLLQAAGSSWLQTTRTIDMRGLENDLGNPVGLRALPRHALDMLGPCGHGSARRSNTAIRVQVGLPLLETSNASKIDIDVLLASSFPRYNTLSLQQCKQVVYLRFVGLQTGGIYRFLCTNACI